jgi:hypothetical protein
MPNSQPVVFILSDTNHKNLRNAQFIVALVAMICSISILCGSIAYVWLPSFKSPKLETEWNSSYGNKDGNTLFLLNQSQVRSVNITLRIYNTGSVPAHGVGVTFEYTTGIGGIDYLLIYTEEQIPTITYSNSYHQGLLQGGAFFSVIVQFEVSFYGMRTSSQEPLLSFQIFSSDLPTINIAIEMKLV